MTLGNALVYPGLPLYFYQEPKSDFEASCQQPLLLRKNARKLCNVHFALINVDLDARGGRRVTWMTSDCPVCHVCYSGFAHLVHTTPNLAFWHNTMPGCCTPSVPDNQSQPESTQGQIGSSMWETGSSQLHMQIKKITRPQVVVHIHGNIYNNTVAMSGGSVITYYSHFNRYPYIRKSYDHFMCLYNYNWQYHLLSINFTY